jgi:hypothetical protein
MYGMGESIDQLRNREETEVVGMIKGFPIISPKSQDITGVVW